nr:hypothetical protein [Ningiella sp. W23]
MGAIVEEYQPEFNFTVKNRKPSQANRQKQA